MLDEKIYDKLYQGYDKISSFAIWDFEMQKGKTHPVGGGMSYPTGDILIQEKSNLRSDRVIISPNPSHEDAGDHDFSMHHAVYKKDREKASPTGRNMRYAFYDSDFFYKEWYGAYLTDLFPNLGEVNFKVAQEKMSNASGHEKQFAALTDQLELLASDSHLPSDETIKLMFTVARPQNKKYYQFLFDYKNYLLDHPELSPLLLQHKIELYGGYQFFYITGIPTTKNWDTEFQRALTLISTIDLKD